MSASVLTQSEKGWVNQQFRKLLETVGRLRGLPETFNVLSGYSNEQLVTTSDMTLYVSQATGSDVAGDGSVGNPYASIMKAVDSVPHIRRHTITINVGAGTYAETLRDGGIYSDNGTFTGKLQIVGQDFTTPTLGSGSITTGTLGTAPSTGITRTVAGAAWTVDELRGMLIRITSGALSGQYFPIVSNAAGSLDVPSTSASLNSATFQIVQPAVIITRGTGLQASVNVGNGGGGFGSNCFVVQRVRLNCGSFYGLYVGQGGVQLLECVVSGQTFAGVQVVGFNSQVVLSRTYIENSNIGISGNESSSLSCGAVGINGGTVGVQITASMRFSTNSAGHLVVQNASQAGMDFRTGPMFHDSFTAQKVILRANAIGLRLQSNAHMLMQGWEITGNSSHGIMMNAANQYTASHNGLNAFGCKITGNGGDGIRVETTHNHVHFGGAGADISGNTGYGLRIGGTPAGYSVASHNNAFLDSNVTMGTNTAGDITHDNGVTTKTIAQVRVDTAEVSSSLFNRVSAV